MGFAGAPGRLGVRPGALGVLPGRLGVLPERLGELPIVTGTSVSLKPMAEMRSVWDPRMFVVRVKMPDESAVVAAVEFFSETEA